MLFVSAVQNFAMAEPTSVPRMETNANSCWVATSRMVDASADPTPQAMMFGAAGVVLRSVSLPCGSRQRVPSVGRPSLKKNTAGRCTV